MNADTFVGTIDTLGFFTGYSSNERRQAERQFRDNPTAGLQGELRKFYEAYPGGALTLIWVPGEWDYEPYDELLELYRDGSFGAFLPDEIEDTRSDDDVTATLSFTFDGTRYSRTVEHDGWVPEPFLELINEAVAEQRPPLRFHTIHHPGAEESLALTLCGEDAWKAIVEAGLVPTDPAEVYTKDWR